MYRADKIPWVFSYQPRFVGRAGPVETILTILIAGAVYMAMVALLGPDNGTVMWDIAFALQIFLLAMVFASALVRRLHDRDLSAWRLLFLIIPMAWVTFLPLVLLLPGSSYENEYGRPRRR